MLSAARMRVAGGVDESTITLMKVVAAALDPCCKSSNGLIECVPACGPVFRIKLGFLHPAQKCAGAHADGASGFLHISLDQQSGDSLLFFHLEF